MKLLSIGSAATAAAVTAAAVTAAAVTAAAAATQCLTKYQADCGETPLTIYGANCLTIITRIPEYRKGRESVNSVPYVKREGVTDISTTFLRTCKS